VVIALMMEAASTSETSVNFYQTTRRYNPADSHLRDFLSLSQIHLLQYHTGLTASVFLDLNYGRS
jgi:hypothetical protein